MTVIAEFESAYVTVGNTEHTHTHSHSPSPTARGGLVPPPSPQVLRTHIALPSERPLLPPSQAHHDRRRVIALGRDLLRKLDQLARGLVGRFALLDNVANLLVRQRGAHAVADEHHEGEFGGLELAPRDLGLGGYAETLLRDVAEGTCVCEHPETLLAERVGDEGGGVAAQTTGLGGAGRVVVCGHGHGETGRGGAEQDACVAEVRGDEC